VSHIHILSFTVHLVTEEYITNCCPFIHQTWTSETNIYMWHMLEDKSMMQPEQDRQCTCSCNNETCSHNHCCNGKAISIIYSQCVSEASVIQHAKYMCHIILSSVNCMHLQYFPTLPHKWH